MHRRRETVGYKLTGRKATVALIALGLALLGASAARASVTYKIQPIVKLGDTVGGVLMTSDYAWDVGALNDNGQLVFIAADGAPGPLLILYADGQLTPIVIAGTDAPVGKWSKDSSISTPVSMNQQGNIAFAAGILQGGSTDRATFRWDAKTRQVTPVALVGMPAIDNLSYVVGGGPTPVINNRDDVVFVASVKNLQGKVKTAIFFLGHDGKLLPAAMPDQHLPDGDELVSALQPEMNDAGVVGFRGTKLSNKLDSGYVWENGTLSLVAQVDSDAPGGGKLAQIRDVRPNNTNRSLLVGARIDDRKAGNECLYTFADGKLTPAVITGQEMPGGGTFKSVGNADDQVTPPDDTGRRAFLAKLEDGATAAYLLDADGKLSLILKSGMTTELGTITSVGLGTTGRSTGLGLNNKGQIALAVSFDNGVDTVVLLTPVVE
jgi:hypothetical protein